GCDAESGQLPYACAEMEERRSSHDGIADALADRGYAGRPATQAILYGPLVLAGKLGADGLTKEMTVGPLGPSIRKHPLDVPAFQASGAGVNTWVQPVRSEALTFQTHGQAKDITLV